MVSKFDSEINKTATAEVDHDGAPPPEYTNGIIQDENTYQYDDSRKLGITGSVFLILNKMIGTGSKCLCSEEYLSSQCTVFSTPSGIFAATGSVGVSLFLWVIGMPAKSREPIQTTYKP